jgi:hypothetical protein
MDLLFKTWFKKDIAEVVSEGIWRQKTGGYHEYSTDMWEVIDDMNQWSCVKELLQKEEHAKHHYNVYVYKVLPYPPHSKDKREPHSTNQ